MFKRSQIQLIAFVLCLFMALAGCKEEPRNETAQAAYEINQPYYRGPVRVQLRLKDDTMALSGLLPLEILTEIDPDYELQFPAVNETLKQFKIRSMDDQPQRLSDNNKVVKIYHYWLEPLDIGPCEIPPLTFTFGPKDSAQGDLKSDSLTTESVWIDVTTSLTADIQDVAIEDIEDVVEMNTKSPWALVAGGGLVLGILIAIATVITVIVRKKQSVIETRRIYKPAHQIALEFLKAIADEKLVEQGHIKSFYEKVSGCLRQYIENRFELRAPEQTTEEFLEQLKTSSALKPEYKQDLRKFLEHCDLVKFARYQPSHEQINESLNMAEQFVHKTKSDAYLVDITEQAQAERQGV